MAMTELERMAREILAASGPQGSMPKHVMSGMITPHASIADVMTALTQAPPGWKLVPVDLMDPLKPSRATMKEHDSWSDFSEKKIRARGYNAARQDALNLFAAAPEYKEGE